MLAALSILGLSDIHEMNSLKVVFGGSINGIAAALLRLGRHGALAVRADHGRGRHSGRHTAARARRANWAARRCARIVIAIGFVHGDFALREEVIFKNRSLLTHAVVYRPYMARIRLRLTQPGQGAHAQPGGDCLGGPRNRGQYRDFLPVPPDSAERASGGTPRGIGGVDLPGRFQRRAQLHQRRRQHGLHLQLPHVPRTGKAPAGHERPGRLPQAGSQYLLGQEHFRRQHAGGIRGLFPDPGSAPAGRPDADTRGR